MPQPKNHGPTSCDEHADNEPYRRSSSPTARNASRWQAPTGVAAGTWDYVNRAHIGDGYDAFVQNEPLTAIERQLLSRYLPSLNRNDPSSGRKALPCNADPAPLVVDFGCGTGRTLLPLLKSGYRGLGVDLSESMLRNLQQKILLHRQANDRTNHITSPLTTIQANLVQLSCLAENSADHGTCMLSTLGMIEGASNRATFLRHARRIIRPRGTFFVHAHSYFYQLRHPGGVRWAAANAWDSLRGSAELGDRLATYRQVTGMFIHQFRRRELARALTVAGFTEQNWFGIKAGSVTPTPVRAWHHPFKFVGWVVAAR
jgi:SAM-dependent methyltransferase